MKSATRATRVAKVVGACMPRGHSGCSHLCTYYVPTLLNTQTEVPRGLFKVENPHRRSRSVPSEYTGHLNSFESSNRVFPSSLFYCEQEQSCYMHSMPLSGPTSVFDKSIVRRFETMPFKIQPSYNAMG
jgi:hypothetical protein